MKYENNWSYIVTLDIKVVIIWNSKIHSSVFNAAVILIFRPVIYRGCNTDRHAAKFEIASVAMYVGSYTPLFPFYCVVIATDLVYFIYFSV